MSACLSPLLAIDTKSFSLLCNNLPIPGVTRATRQLQSLRRSRADEHGEKKGENPMKNL